MKCIIAGGRSYQLTTVDYAKLDGLEITEVVSGGCTGADSCGEEWAKIKGIPVKRFKPDWDKHGRNAGPIRNGRMASYADAAALFPGGRGTESMLAEAKRAGIVIYDFRSNNR